ncbi:MAG: hypothetical protein HGA67_03000 [Candidatus Yonathbacteria bacterium]|nr:hypothetical protein [Candidatus Yonathbacteria bacterium]
MSLSPLKLFRHFSIGFSVSFFGNMLLFGGPPMNAAKLAVFGGIVFLVLTGIAMPSKLRR